MQDSEPLSASTVNCGNLKLPQFSSIKLPPWHYNIQQSPTSMSQEKAELLERNTNGQVTDPEWHNQRKDRLTASQMGIIIKRKKTPTQSFLNTIFKNKPIYSKSLSYGRANEIKAKSKYLDFKQKSIHIHDCGLIVNPEFPFLGATPDGKVCDRGECGILEIKCPYSARDLSISQACESIKNFTLVRDGSIFKINPLHNNFYQVHGQLLVSGAPWCDFVVFTKSDLCVIRIKPDVAVMTDMLLHLCLFYKKWHHCPRS